jgi:uncharacterized protein YaaR (DUF327 family)
MISWKKKIYQFNQNKSDFKKSLNPNKMLQHLISMATLLKPILKNGKRLINKNLTLNPASLKSVK